MVLVCPPTSPILAAQRDDDLPGLRLPYPRREPDGVLVVGPLLRIDRRLVEVDERRRVDIDVVEAGRDRLVDERLDLRELALGVGGHPPGACLQVVALDEERPPPSLVDGGGVHRRCVLGGALRGVAHLGACQLEDDGARIEIERCPQDAAKLGIAEPAVDGGHGRPGPFAAGAGFVERLDGGRPRPEGARGGAQQPVRRGPHLGRAVGAGGGETSGEIAKLRLVADIDAMRRDGDDAIERCQELVRGRERVHRRGPSLVRGAPCRWSSRRARA